MSQVEFRLDMEAKETVDLENKIVALQEEKKKAEDDAAEEAAKCARWFVAADKVARSALSSVIGSWSADRAQCQKVNEAIGKRTSQKCYENSGYKCVFPPGPWGQHGPDYLGDDTYSCKWSVASKATPS